MEIFPYMIDVVMFGIACYWSAANAVNKPGAPTFGLFRYRDRMAQAPAKLADRFSPRKRV